VVVDRHPIVPAVGFILCAVEAERLPAAAMRTGRPYVTPMTQGQRAMQRLWRSATGPTARGRRTSRLELALRHVARTSTLDDARTVAARALVLHNESARDAVKGTGR
jgi:hypothetical protein